MHVEQIVNLAHFVARKSASVDSINQEQLDGTLGQYWVNSKCRIQYWQDDLARLEHNLCRGSSDHHPGYWHAAAPIANEVLFANVLTSVATATVLSVPESGDELSPIVMGVLESEREARFRLEMMLELACDRNLRQRRSIPLLSDLAFATRQSAIWADLMLGFLPSVDQAARCGHLPDRVRQNHSNFATISSGGKANEFHKRIATDTESYFGNHKIASTSTCHLNAKICRTIQLAFGLTRQRPMAGLTPTTMPTPQRVGHLTS